MDYSQFTDNQLKKRIKEARLRIELLDQQETDMMLELSHREGQKTAYKLQQNIINFINS